MVKHLETAACRIQNDGSGDMILLELLDCVVGFPLQTLAQEIACQVLKQDPMQ
jgi:hypothetical protein